MTNKVVPELDKLFAEVGAYRKSPEFGELFAFMKKLPHIAPYNAMLIYIQKPGSEFVASANTWKKQYNRSIKAGSRPLIILQPFGPVAFVYELGDTYGEEPFPTELLAPFKTAGEVPDINFHCLLSNLKCDGVAFQEADPGTGSVGQIQKIRKGDTKQEFLVVAKKKRIAVRALYELIVNKNHSNTAKFATIARELGRLYCGHLGMPDAKWKGWKDRRKLDSTTREFEAESVCWLICERMGLRNPSAEYLKGYLGSHNEIPDISLDAVLKAAGHIETMIVGNKEPRQEIVIRTEEMQPKNQQLRIFDKPVPDETISLF